jgi:hypothetical protein
MKVFKGIDCETLRGEECQITVGLDPNAPEGPGVDLKTKTPNVLLQTFIGGRVAALTWDEARELAAMIIRITNIAEFG